MRWFAVILFGIISLIVLPVYADSGVISPLADSPLIPIVASQPSAAYSITAPNVLGVQTSLGDAVTQFFNSTPTPTPTPQIQSDSAAISPTPTPTPIPRTTRKAQMTVTLLGDSMIDTLGPDGGGLAARLNKVYPKTTFTIINHGVGGENIDTGLKHLTNGYAYIGTIRPSVISQSPDIIVVESFGYNPYPYDTGAIETHWLQLANIMNTIKQNLPQTKIVIAATIAPNWDVFGDGAPFINMSADGKRQKVATIDSYIESTIGFAKSEHYPLADAYHQSKGSDGNGMIQYINPGDHIHYSDAGRTLFSQTVASTITNQKLLE